MNIVEDFKARGLIENTSHDELLEKLNTEKISFYIGYDPTAKSLQIGNLFAIVTMRRLQLAGHKPFVLVGGATGMIGDPSGKSAERNLLDEKTLQDNIDGQTAQLKKFLEFDNGDNCAVIVNNYDWMKNFTFLDFLRVVGKRFRLTEMLAKDSVKSRLNSESGISYTEFSYQMLQAYDFAYLNEKHGVTLQVGGGDQWGNITAGIDLTRKMHGNQVYGLVVPLVTDSQGKKFGKSEGGQTIYLDPMMTSPYKMYQYLLNSDDESVIRYLKFYTFLTLEEIANLEQMTKTEPHLRQAQKTLAAEVTKLVHGQEGIDAALRATSFFFGGEISNISDSEVESIFEDVPSVSLTKNELNGELSILDLLSQTPLFKSKGEARRSLDQKGVYLNNKAISDSELKITTDSLASESSMVIRKGKKNYCVVKFL